MKEQIKSIIRKGLDEAIEISCLSLVEMKEVEVSFETDDNSLIEIGFDFKNGEVINVQDVKELKECMMKFIEKNLDKITETRTLESFVDAKEKALFLDCYVCPDNRVISIKIQDPSDESEYQSFLDALDFQEIDYEITYNDIDIRFCIFKD